MRRHPQIAIDLADMGYWAPTVPQLRGAIEGGYVSGMSMQQARNFPPAARQYFPTGGEVDAITSYCRGATRAGRIIDFGHLPNAVMMSASLRGMDLYRRGFLPHPFTEPWLLMHSWEEAVAVYLVSPIECDDDNPALPVEVAELQPVALHGLPNTMIVGDRIFYDPAVEPDSKGYVAQGAPAPWRFLPQCDNGRSRTPEKAAVANVLDPLMTALMILSTRNVARETISADPKLQKARLKNGKTPIPPYDRVNSQPYVTAILAGSGRRE